jgi:hypothetical protein
MTSARVSFLAPVAAAMALALASCGGGSSPVTPVSPTPVPDPTPSPVGGGESASANTCPIGKGDPDASCAKASPQLLAAVEAAIDRLVREKPQLFNLLEEAGEDTGQYRVLAADEYLDGLIASLRAAGLCAERTLDRERLVVKSTNAFSEEWDVLSSSGFVRRGSYAYRQTCTPSVFPVDPQDIIAYVRTAFFSFECNPGIVAPHPREGKLRLGCDGFVTATPKQRNDDDVPSWIHGTEIEWELRDGDDVVRVEPDPRFANPFNKIVRPTGSVGGFVLCASVLGREGCLNGRTIP